jgi:Uma2 family endonuclease
MIRQSRGWDGRIRPKMHMSSATVNTSSELEPGPAWEIARLFPDQGDITEAQYLRLTDHSNRLAEFIDGTIEVLPMPTIEHQRIVVFLLEMIRAFVIPRKLGEALVAGVRVRTGDRQYREPDVVFLRRDRVLKQGNRYWELADLVMEVVSDDDPSRDLVTKRKVYADAGIPEYWIVDPRNKSIVVLRLDRGQYVTHCEATGSGLVRSALLDGLTVEAADVFAAGQGA